MNKTPIITIVAMLLVVVFAFSGCELDIELDNGSNVETSVETVVVTDEEGSTSLETVVHYISNEPPVVTVVEVTDDKGKVVATEKVTLSPDEIEEGKNFFDSSEEKETTEISKEPATDRVTKPSAENVEVQDDFAVLNSDTYLVEGRVVDAEGNTYPYKMARKGERCSAMTVFEGQELCVIVGFDSVYLVTPENKSYVKVAKTLVQDEAQDDELVETLLTGDGFNLYANKTKVDSYTEKMYGVKYTVVEYDDGTLDYFNGKTLVQTVATDDSVLYYDVISSDVSEGVFIPPANYTEQVIDAEDLSTTAVCTDPNHNHSHDDE